MGTPVGRSLTRTELGNSFWLQIQFSFRALLSPGPNVCVFILSIIIVYVFVHLLPPRVSFMILDKRLLKGFFRGPSTNFARSGQFPSKPAKIGKQLVAAVVSFPLWLWRISVFQCNYSTNSLCVILFWTGGPQSCPTGVDLRRL